MTAKKKRRPTRDRLAFWRKNYLNPRLVRVELDDGEVADVIVRDNSLYCQGMEFPVRLEGENFYEQRVPRQRGKL